MDTTDLDRIWDLQGVDQSLQAAREALEAHPHRLERDRWSAEAARLASEEQESQARLRSLTLDLRRHELDVKATEQEVEQIEKRLFGGTVANPKELSNLQSRLESTRERLSGLQDEALSAMIQIEEEEKRLASVSSAGQSARRELSSAEAAWEGTETAIRQEIEELTRRRDGLIASIANRAWLARYERLLPAKQGRAVAPVEGETCGGCGVPLPTYFLEEVRRKQKMMLCEVCGRILYGLPPKASGTGPPLGQA